MRSSRRRNRRPDPLATPEAVRNILSQLNRQCSTFLPKSESLVLKMLESARHHERHPAKDESRGRPRRWPREDVAIVAKRLKSVLERKTNSRVSVSSFVSLYLPILRYPTDIVSALKAKELNIREASYLARLTPSRLNCTVLEARQIRTDLLKVHLQTKGSQNNLRLRVKSILGETLAVGTDSVRSGLQKADEIIKQDPYDPRHLFFEEIQLLTSEMGRIEPVDLSARTLAELLRQVDKLLNMLHRIGRHRGA